MRKNFKPIVILAIAVQPLLFQGFLYAGQSATSATAETADVGQSPGNEHLNARLLDAVKSQNLDELQQVLEDGADINHKFKKGRTALFYAIKKHSGLIADALVNNGADIEAKDDAGNTPLIYAVKKSEFKAVQVLLSYGADTQAQDASGRTALELAKRDDSKEIADLIKQNRDFHSALGLFVDLQGKQVTQDKFRQAAFKAFETKNWQNISAEGNQVSGIYETGSRIFKSTMIYEPNLVVIKFEPAMGYRKPYYLENLRAVFFSELENQQ